MDRESPRVAVVGCGYWGKNLVRNFAAIDALAMVCDVTEPGRQLAAEITAEVPIVSSYEDVLSSSVDGVVIATPAETHYDLARAAIRSGKDVFVEKPLALNSRDGYAIEQLAQKHERQVLVGHVLEYHPAVRKLHDLIVSGELGKIHYVYSNRLSLGKIRREENVLWSFAPHDVAVILRLVGSEVVQVAAVGDNYVQPRIADVTVTNLLFENGVRSHIYVSWLHPFKEQRLVVIGSQRMASFDDVAKELVIYDQRVNIEDGEPIPVRGDGKAIEFSNDEPLRCECEAFLEAIRTREAAKTDAASGVRVLEVLQSAQRSLVTGGQPVAVSRGSHGNVPSRRAA